MSRAASIARYVLIGFVAGVLLLAGLVYVLTRTPWGIERVSQYGIDYLAKGIQGTLHVGRVRGDNLLAGVTVEDLVIQDRQGQPFLKADSATVAYSWRTLLGGQLVFDHLELFGPELHLTRLPGDTLWNYERIFRDTTGTPPGPPRLIALTDVTVHHGAATVAYPYVQHTPIQPGDTARLLVRKLPGGLERMLRFENLDARLPQVTWETPAEPGKLFKIAALSGRGYVWTTPFDLSDARGTVTLRDTVVAFDVPELQLSQSRASVLGRVVVRDSGNAYDVRIAADTVAFRDLGWLYPRLPETGGGTGEIRFTTVPRGTLWMVSDAHLAAPGSKVAGSFGIVTGDTLYFTRVNLRASPLDLDFIAKMLPSGLPVKGLMVGTVVVDGPLSALTTRGNVRFAGAGDAGSAAASWRGTLDLRPPYYAARDFHADVSRLDLALVNRLRPGMELAGSVSGQVDASGRLDRSLRLAGAIEHALPGRPTSRVEGDGTVSWAPGGSSFDLRLRALPVELTALADAFPALERLRGSARGPVSVSGSLDDLRVDADLETAAGQVALHGRLSLDSVRPRYALTGRLGAFRLDQVLDSIPATMVSGRFSVDGAGKGLAGTTAAVRFLLDSASVGGLPLQDGLVQLHVADGLASVDSLRLGDAAGTLHGSGSFGLAPGRRGRLELTLRADSLHALQSLLFPGTAEADALDAPARFAGALDGTATVEGGLGSFDVSGKALASRLVYGGAMLDSGTITVEAKDVTGALPSLHLDVEVDTVRRGERRVADLSLQGDYGAGTGRLQVHGFAPDGGRYHVAFDFERGIGETDALISELGFGIGSGTWALAQPARLRLGGGTLHVDSLVLARAGGGAIRAGGALAWGGPQPTGTPLDFRLDLRQVPLADYLELAQTAPPGGGLVSGDLQLSGSSREPVVRGALTVDSLRYGDVRLDRVETHVDYADQRLDARVQGSLGGTTVFAGSGLVPLDLTFAPTRERLPDQDLSYTVRADGMPASLLTALLPGFEATEGRLDGSVHLSGTTRAPRFGGEVKLSGGATTWDATGVRYRDLAGTFAMQGDGTVAVDATAQSGGTARVTGSVAFGSSWSNPKLDLGLSLSEFQAAKRRDVEVTASGNVRLAGEYRHPRVSGDLRVDRGALHLDEIWRRYQIVGLDDPLLFDVVDTSLVATKKILPTVIESDFLRNLAVDSFTVDVGRDAWLRSKEMNLGLSGSVSVAYDRSSDDLRMTGTLHAVRGTYLLYGRRFDVKQGTIEFYGTPGIDPGLNFTAVYRVRTDASERSGDVNGGVNVEATVTGTLQSPRVALTSDAQPAISESDLVSYLLFGHPTYALSQSQRSATQLAGNILAPTVFGYAASGLETVARNLGFDYVSLSSAEGVSSDQANQAFGGLFAGTQLDVGWYLSDRLFLSFSQRFAARSTGTELPGMRLEWRFQPTWNAEFYATDRSARSFGPSLNGLVELKRVYGFSLFRDWSY